MIPTPMTKTILLAAVLMALAVACAQTETRKEVGPPLEPPKVTDTKPHEYPGLHQVVAYTADVWSGALPEGDEGFDSLARLGIKTIISVDGGATDVARAEAHGLRYVHLPHGYDGIDLLRRLELARAVHDLEKPVYIHCHHGKHRSAAAVGSVCVALGYLKHDEAEARMHVSGIAAQYKGLFQAVRDSQPVDEATLKTADDSFPAHAKVSDMVEAMVEIDFAFENIQHIEKAGWTTPKDHPDLVPAAELGRMADHFRNGGETLPAEEQRELAEWMHRSYRQVADLEDALVAGRETTEQMSARFKAIAQNCKDCHAKHRN
jgi:protein tyrosine phosphatase (PTP) superfamily phosphohydrolase (DUF442 family)